MESSKTVYAHTVIRILIGLMFVLAGINKYLGLGNEQNVIGMLGNLGFPAPMFFGWLLLLSEIVFGLAFLVGWKVKYTAWPLVIILAVAIFTVTAPGALASKSVGGWTGVFFHLIALVALLHISWEGPGALAVSKE